MPVIVIPSSTGANTVFVNADTGRNVVLSGIGGQNSVILSGFKETVPTPPHNSLVGLQGGSVSQYYHLNSGQYFNLVTGQVVRPSDTGNFYPTSNPSGYITGLDLSNYSTISFSTGISGYLQNQVTNLNNQTGSYYPKNNPSGYITGVDLSSYATIGFVTGISGSIQNQITNLNNQTGSYVTGSVVRPSETGVFVTQSQTGQFYAASNPSGFITGVDLSAYITGINNIVYATGNQDISGLKDFQTRPTVLDVPVLISGDAVDTIHLYGKNDQGTTIYKGQPVYINGANGANPLIQLASNTGERTSSKTIGLLYQDLSVNQFGYIITEGLLEGFNTSAGVVGDPMWLGPSGSIIYGTGNKPYGNDHLVSLGIVLRSNNNNGKVYVKVQNGFEIEELHKVYAINRSDKDTLLYNSASGAWFARQINTGDVSGISNYYLGSNPSGFITGISNLVYTTGDQSITGVKTFLSPPTISGNQVATVVDPVRTTLTGNGVLSAFAISGAGSLSNPSALIVAIDGALQEPTVDYGVSGGVITFTSPLANGAKAVVISPTNTLQVTQMILADGSVTSAKLANDLEISGDLEVVGELTASGQPAIGMLTDNDVMTRLLAAYEGVINGNEFRQMTMTSSQQVGVGSSGGTNGVLGMQATVTTALNGSASVYAFDGVNTHSGFSGAIMRSNILIDAFFHGCMFRVEANLDFVFRINFGVGAPTRVPPAAGVAAASARQWGVEFYYDGTNYVGRMYWYNTSMNYGTPFIIPNLTAANWAGMVYSMRMKQTSTGLLEFYINSPTLGLGGGRLSDTPIATMQATWTSNFYGGRHINFEAANGTAAAATNTRIHCSTMFCRIG